MTETCRICLSHNLVNNFIFDEDNKIYLKILSCLPIKINKDDVLPKKICDVCSCKVDDFYKFCHKSIDSENRLLFSSCNEEAGITNVEHDSKIYQFSSSFLQFHKNGYAVDCPAPSISPKNLVSSCTQTEDETFSVSIKQEPQGNNDNFFDNYDDDNSDREFDKHEENQFDEIKIELSPQVKKVVDKDNEKVASKRKSSSRKNKKEKRPIKVKIKKNKSKFRVTPESKSDSDEDVSLVDIIKKDKNLKLNEITSISHGTIVLDVKDIKTELMDVLNDGENNANVNREEWNCCICFFRCFEKEEMLGHYRSHYSTKDMQEFESEQMTSETVQDKNGKPVAMFVCSHCNVKSETKVKHLRHLRSHGLDKPYKCSLCEKTFRSTAEILKHGKNAHKYDNDLQEAKLEGEESGGAGPMRAIKRFMCDLCDETFVYMKYVQIHRNLCHPEAKERQFVNRCLHCGREFAHLNSLRRHLRSHSGERNFLCYICGKSLSSREHLKFHIRIHTGFKPHICKTCGKGFVKKCNLTLHERVHSGEKPHVCSHCGKAFSQRSTLVIHERYHSGARPYVCSLCNKGFVAKGLLSMHLKTSCI